MGVWIETPIKEIYVTGVSQVTPCVGVWIETGSANILSTIAESHPAWACGLKQTLGYDVILYPCHTLRGCVD